jgi:photosystem II stability/assembly factor-like uncharacterized protein
VSKDSLAALAAVIAIGMSVSAGGTEPPRAAGFFQDFAWRSVGPFRGGRTRAVAGVATQPNVFYIGAVNGGVWKSDDAGRSWRPIFDEQPTQSIGAIAVAPSDPNVVYVGSGEGLHRPDLSIGDGIYRSADAGRTWTHLGLRSGAQIPELAVDPRDADRLFAAVLGRPFGASTERGVYRSVDGGRNWQRVLFVDENSGASSVAIDPQHPEVVYAALWEARMGPWEDNNDYNGTGGGLFKSTDGGSTWRRIGTGLPDNVSQLNIAIAASQSSRLFVSLATAEDSDYGSSAGLGIFRSDDSGETWARVTQDPRPALRIGGGDLPVLRVDPSDPDVVYSASIVTMKSVDGGKSWSGFRGAPGGDDYQNLWISPADSRIVALVGDQGALVTVNGGQSWSSWLNQPTAQLYHVGVTPGFPYRLCSGQQESGSVCITSRGNDGAITARDWHPVGVIEYGYVAPDPSDADVIFGAGRNQVSKFHISTGQVQSVTPVPIRGGAVRVDRTQPIMFVPQDPRILYYAANVLYRSADRGASWTVVSPDLGRKESGIPPSVGKLHPKDAEKQRGVIYSLAVSPKDANTLWAGTDDGLVWVTRDGGKHWVDATPTELGPWSKVTQIDASHSDAGTAYCSVSGFRIDDDHPQIFRTRDGGKNWQRITAGLGPDAAVNTVREDPVRPGLLFAGTETAVWISFDDGEHWESLQQNLPHTSIRDLWIHEGDLIAATHGRGFWILDDIARLRESSPAMLRESLLEPAPAVRVRRSTWTDTPLAPDEPTGANPPVGAVLEYAFTKDVASVVTLEILDAHGGLVRRLASDDAQNPSEEELRRQLIPPYWSQVTGPLPVTAGVHRVVWDLRYPAPFAATRGYPISAVPGRTPRDPEGPLALPGRYTVRLTVEGRRYERTLRVLPDPRVHVAPQALAAQWQLSSRLGDLLSESSHALVAAKSLNEQLKAVPTGAAPADSARALSGRIDALLAAPKGAAPGTVGLAGTPGRLGGLYESLARADAAPSHALRAAAHGAESAFRSLAGDWQRILGELPALNAQIRAAGLAELRPDQPPARDLNAADEE